MASSIDKGLYQAPEGLASDENPMLTIEIADADAQPGLEPDGSMVVDLSGEGDEPQRPEDTEFGQNLADSLDQETINSIITDLEYEIGTDKQSRHDWEQTYKDGLDLLGLKIEERTQPWDGACGIVHPMITEAVVRFQAETSTETFPACGPVLTKIVGLETPMKREAAARVKDDMNYQLTECMSEFKPEHERLLWELPCVGAAFKKVYFDESLDRPVSMFVSAEDVILPYGTTDLSSCYRITHVIRKTKDQLLRQIEAGFYCDVSDTLTDEAPQNSDDVKAAKDALTGATEMNDDRYTLFEAHVDLVIEGDSKRPSDRKSALPYVVTFIKGTNTMLAIRRNWQEGDKDFCRREHFVQYNYVPGFGSYGYGLFHLIGGYAKGATAMLRQLVDAGTLSNLPGGLKTRGLRIKGDETPIAPGEFRDVDIGSGTIQENIMTLPYKEPSATLAALLDKVVEDARRFASTADMQISDMSAQAPVGTTLALLERQLKVLTAVQARVHYALKRELKLLKTIIQEYTPTTYDYDPATGIKSAKKADYDLCEVIPVSDPNASTLSQRVVQFQAAIQMAQMAPQIYNLAELHRGMLDVLGIKDANKIVPLPEDMLPTDPVTENMSLLKMKPVKAFIYQDHRSHMAVHQMAMQDPTIMQAMGQNPQAPMIMAAATAHIAEHMGYLHRQEIEARLGLQLPPEGQVLPPEVEIALSQMMAQAAQQVLQQNQALQAVQASQASQNDPVLMLQQQELAIKQQDSQTKATKVQLDAAAKNRELGIREKQTQLQGVTAAHQILNSNAQTEGQHLQAGMQTGVDIAKSREQAAQAREAQQHNQQLAVQDQQHRHQLEQQQFAADTAHKAHTTVLGENKQRRTEQFQRDQADNQAATQARGEMFQQQQHADSQEMQTNKLDREDRRTQAQAEQQAKKEAVMAKRKTAAAKRKPGAKK